METLYWSLFSEQIHASARGRSPAICSSFCSSYRRHRTTESQCAESRQRKGVDEAAKAERDLVVTKAENESLEKQLSDANGMFDVDGKEIAGQQAERNKLLPPQTQVYNIATAH